MSSTALFYVMVVWLNATLQKHTRAMMSVKIRFQLNKLKLVLNLRVYHKQAVQRLVHTENKIQFVLICWLIAKS